MVPIGHGPLCGWTSTHSTRKVGSHEREREFLSEERSGGSDKDGTKIMLQIENNNRSEREKKRKKGNMKGKRKS